MKVILKATDETVEVNESYGSRLFEQGKAIPAPKETPKVEPTEEPEAEPKEKPKTTAKKKG